MGNMSYCRFENTNNDVIDCLDAIRNRELDEMSEYEMRGFVNFIQNCMEVAEQFDGYSRQELTEFIEGQQSDYDDEE